MTQPVPPPALAEYEARRAELRAKGQAGHVILASHIAKNGAETVVLHTPDGTVKRFPVPPPSQ